MNITKKLISIIIIITIVLCSSLNLFNNISYATEGENSNNTSSGNTPENGQQTQTDTEPSGNTTGSEANNDKTNNESSQEEQNQEQNQNQSQSQNQSETDNTQKITPTTKTTTTTTKTTTAKSNNANLSDLGIKPNDFKGFKPGITSYDVEVENSVTSIEIYAKTQDPYAKATGGGKKNLSEGKNSFNIVVTAQNGTKKTYTINITRKVLEEDKEEKKEENTSSQEINFEENINDKVFGLSKLTVEGIKLSPEFKSDIYEYTANYEGEATALNIMATAGQEGSNVEIIGNENLADGENLINILVTDNEGNIYTYQITLKKNLSESHSPIKKEILLVIGIGAGAILLLIIIIIISRKNKKNNKEKLETLPIIEDTVDEEAERIAFVNSILQTNLETKEEQKPYVQDSWFKKEEKEEKIEKIEKQDEEEHYNGPLIYEPEDNYDYNYEVEEVKEKKHKKKKAKGKRFK